ncbi:MAG: cytochrome c biogenesis protein CcsA [Bacteroidia bacterium]|nr:cytochrome c biogenesis protein CcsA [Bacteroidia bacterium]
MTRMSSIRIAYQLLAVLLLLYGIIYGMMATLPELPALQQSARIMFYHVPMWFSMLTLMGMSLYHSIRLLLLMDPDRVQTENPLLSDIRATEAARIGVIFNILGLATGIIWSRVSWAADRPSHEFSSWWAWDPIQVCALVGLLIYLAYFQLRASFKEPSQRARIAAVYNIFAFATLIPLFFIVPKMFEGLHPTAAKGSFIFKKDQISNEFRLILYPTMLGFILMGVWAYELRTRLVHLALRLEEWRALRAYTHQSSTR